MKKFISISFLSIFIFAFFAGAGCASRRTVTEHTVTPSSTVTTTSGSPSSSTTVTQPVVKEETTTVETRERPGGVFDVVGSVLALPFRLVAGLLELIF